MRGRPTDNYEDSEEESEGYDEYSDESDEEVKDEEDYDKKKETKKRKTPASKKKAPAKKHAKTDLKQSSQLGFKNKSFVMNKSSNNKRAHKNLKQVITLENYQELPPTIPTYVNIEAPPSLYPPKKYCDITGLECKYTSLNGVRYHSAAVFPIIKALNEYRVQDYLGLRGSGSKIK